MQNGSKQYFGASQKTFKLEDGTTQGSVPGNERRFLVSLKSQAPATITQYTLGTYEPSPPTSLDVRGMAEQHPPCTMQGHKISSDVIYDSPPLHDNLHMKSWSPHPTRDPDPNM